MLDYQQRVIDEEVELTNKIVSLTEFIGSGKSGFLTLDVEDRALLREQLEAMRAYRSILRKRIDRFGSK
jgi:hypothetical protein